MCINSTATSAVEDANNVYDSAAWSGAPLTLPEGSWSSEEACACDRDLKGAPALGGPRDEAGTGSREGSWNNSSLSRSGSLSSRPSSPAVLPKSSYMLKITG